MLHREVKELPVFATGANSALASAMVPALRQLGISHRLLAPDDRRSYHGRACDTLVMAAGDPYRWRADEDPGLDFRATLADVAYHVHEVPTRHFVLFSSTGVYADESRRALTVESECDALEAPTAYCLHRRMTEDYVRTFMDSYLILRLPLLIGPGLRRNPVEDWLSDKRINMLTRASSINVLTLDFVAEVTAKLIADKVAGTFNLAASTPVTMAELGNLHRREREPRWGRHHRDQDINTDSISTLVNLPTSRESVLQHLADQRKVG